MSIRFNREWEATRQWISSNYQHWRNLRALMFNTEALIASPRIKERIINELVPLIKEEKFQAAVRKFNELKAAHFEELFDL